MSGLGAKLDAALKPGTVQVEAEGRAAEVEVVDVDRLGATLGRVRVRVPNPAGVQEQAARVPDALRGLPDTVVPVEVAPNLGGAVYRSRIDHIVGGEFFEVKSKGGEAELERLKGAPGGRSRVSFDLTRDQLHRLVDGLADALEGGTGVQYQTPPSHKRSSSPA
jgi:hypothetical protein